jgi:hypothetical protein
MKFSDLTKAIQDAWSFAWPPLVFFIIAYVIAQYFHPNGTNDALRCLVARMKEYGLRLESIRSVLEPYGLTKLVPVISAVVVVGLMHLVNSPLTAVVDNIPPHLTYSPDVLIGQFMSENERLLLLRKYPTAKGMNDAYYLGVESAKAETKNGSANDRVQIWYKVQHFIKFGAAASVILFVASVKGGLPVGPQIAKFAFVLVLLICAWAVSLVGLLYQQEQKFYDEWQPIRLTLQEDATSILATPITDEEKRKIAIDSKRRWWNVNVFNMYRWVWIKKTFILSDQSRNSGH